MAKGKVHWWPPGAAVPRARCGVWLGASRVTRNHDSVTCLGCRHYLLRAGFAVEPIRGRQLEITFRDGSNVRGQLIDAIGAGLELSRRRDGKRILAQWREVHTANFLDTDNDAKESAGDT